MSIKNLAGRLDRVLAAPPRCVPGQTCVIRTQRRYGAPYEITEADRCPLCGALGCGIEVIEEVEVVRGPDGVLVDARGVELVP
ncbi:hypothetical protein J8F10_31860 [Gemmata sp. G18]|uniref:Uncharacterized protein n=1 Tax=Gemmata palustris TaxID=2822762 RepID=A0ABS5C1S2_9BACT|nr:hypothetical protein [Gemmata palustris]MBP3959868.1 hypothetical protein [Gemmata palustris]